MGKTQEAYKLAQAKYAVLGVDTEAAMKALDDIAISMHCWQGDDVSGFENPEAALSGGIQATGNYPGKARTPGQLRQDIDKAISLIPGKKKLSLHAIYGESTDGKPVERSEVAPAHFANWVDWAKKNGMGLDFNPTLFSHPLAADGFTLSSADKTVRDYWIKHCIASRKIGEYFGKELGQTCVTNIWIADGFKDIPVDRFTPRLRLKESLDAILKEKIDPAVHLDAVESKLFGIGSESCVIGSNEFYLGYAAQNNCLLTLDAGHYHPTEVISDKISAVLASLDQILLHVSRPVRWDSDHVVIFSDELRNIAEEIVRNDFLRRVHIGLDFFDASINRIAAWVIGTRNTSKALLAALLEPTAMLKKAEIDGDYTTRLAMLEELRMMPVGAVYDYYCEERNVPVGAAWLDEVKAYEKTVLAAR